MQKAFAKTKYVRISPRKARLAADLIRGKRVEEAITSIDVSVSWRRVASSKDLR